MKPYDLHEDLRQNTYLANNKLIQEIKSTELLEDVYRAMTGRHDSLYIKPPWKIHKRL